MATSYNLLSVPAGTTERAVLIQSPGTVRRAGRSGGQKPADDMHHHTTVFEASWLQGIVLLFHYNSSSSHAEVSDTVAVGVYLRGTI